MNKKQLSLQTAALAVGIALAVPAAAKDVMKTKTVGPYRIELHVLPAEPFYTGDEVAAKHVTTGMVIQGGAVPVKPDADVHPNHHLVVHVFDRKTGQAITDAKVDLSFVAAATSQLALQPRFQLSSCRPSAWVRSRLITAIMS